MKKTITTTLLLLVFSSISFAQNSMDDVHLFQGFLYDSPIFSKPYVDGGIFYGNFDGGNSFSFGAQGGYAINPKFEIDAALGFMSFSPDIGDGQSGISDLTIIGKYNFAPGKTNISAGGLITLPIGEEKVGQGKLNLGGFASLRHPIQDNIIITGNAGLMFIETTTFNIFGKKDSSHKISLHLGGGALYSLDTKITLIGELSIATEEEAAMLTSGVDYNMDSYRLRGALGLGLNDGSPDFALFLSFFTNFN